MQKKQQLTDEDRAIFRAAMEGTSSWDDDKLTPPCQDQHHTAESLPKPNLDLLSSSEWVDAACTLSFSVSKLSGKQQKKLIKGEMRIDRRVDCHGMNIDQALEAFADALNDASCDESRLIHLIHGKGGQKTQGRPAILKNFFNQALRQIQSVLAFHSAQPRHGGTGALYVLLRSNVNKNR